MACVIEKITVLDAPGLRQDPEIVSFLGQAMEALGKDGRLVVRLSGIPSENMVLAQGESEGICQRQIHGFKRLAARKGFAVCEEENTSKGGSWD